MRILSLPGALCGALLLAIAAPATAQQPALPKGDVELAAAVKAAGSSADNGAADLVTVLHDTQVDVEPTGLAHIVEHQLIACLTEKGAAQLARLRFDYDPASNTIELRTLRILRAGGTIETIPATAGVDLPQPQEAIYWGPRMMLYALPRLAPGDAVEFETAMKGFLIAYLDDLAGADADERYIPPMRGHFYDVVTFHEAWPVKLRTYTVATPRDKPVQYETYNGAVPSHVSFDDKALRYSFWMKDVAAPKSEPSSVAQSDALPKVVLATVATWQDKSRWFAEVNTGQFAADDAIRAKVAELTRGLTKDEDKIAAIVHWSADNIRYSGVSMGKGEGYTLHPGTMVFHNRSGVCKDKAGMAITMLRAAGFTVYPAMTMAGSRVERIPADQFNHCVAALKTKDGKFQMLDPTWVPLSTELWSSAEGEQNYLIGTPEGEMLARTDAADPAANGLRLDSKAVLAADGTLSGTLTFAARGLADQRLRRLLLQGTTARDRQQVFEKLVAALGPGATVEEVKAPSPQLEDVKTPLTFTVRYSVPRYALVAGDKLLLAPPMARHIVRWPSLAPYFGLVGPESRTQGLQLGAPRWLEAHETLTLPAGYRVERLPRVRALDGKAASLAAKATLEGATLRYEYTLSVKRRVVEPQDYANFRQVVREADQLGADLAVLAK